MLQSITWLAINFLVNYHTCVQQAHSCTSIRYRIVLQDKCNDDTAEIIAIDDHGGSMNIPYTMNCTNITIIAENSIGTAPNHLVNMTSPG